MAKFYMTYKESEKIECNDLFRCLAHGRARQILAGFRIAAITVPFAGAEASFFHGQQNFLFFDQQTKGRLPHIFIFCISHQFKPALACASIGTWSLYTDSMIGLILAAYFSASVFLTSKTNSSCTDSSMFAPGISFSI